MRTWLPLLTLAWPTWAWATPLDANTCAPGAPPNYGAGYTAWSVPSPTPPGIAMLRRTLTGPESRCNDGSPAVMYLRPSPGGPDADRWVIHFDGGGACTSEAECLARWCGTTGMVFDEASRMSSLGLPEGILAQGGILNTNMGGAFSTYNHVLLHYCSSDNWIGSAARGQAIDPTTGLPPTLDLEFRGEAIVAEAIATLRAGETHADPLAAAHFYDDPLPSLDDAEVVIVSGDSAGGGGARHHVDRIAALLPNADVRLVVDAGFPPAWYKPWIRWSGQSALNPYSDYSAMMYAEHVPVARGFWGVDDSALDLSCLSLAPDPAIHCLDPTWILENHVTTPFFVHQDFTDPAAMPKYSVWGAFTNVMQYAVNSRAQLSSLLAGAGIEPRTMVPGVLGLNCGDHIASRQTNKFLYWTVSGPVPAYDFRELLENWVYGTGPTASLQADDPAVAGFSASICP